ncbi:MAG TPA: hypothetical protein DDW52_26670, partial [Planctomycetaceae bacterium]|nr:hypothetical protein [Planctomycetaceae bacterium]
TPDEAAAAAEPASSNIWATASANLSADQYAALWLRYGEDMDMSEIASVLGKTKVGVRVMLHRARGKLETVLSDEGS